MAVSMYCPNLRCPLIVRVADKWRGKIVQCSECGYRFRVPEAPRLCSPRETNPVVEMAACVAPEQQSAMPAPPPKADTARYRPVVHFTLAQAKYGPS